jgi:hypothetical protein
MVSETTPVVLAEGHKHMMALDQSALLEVLGGDPARRDADRLGRLGRVLGQVRRDGDIGDLPPPVRRTTRGSTWSPQVMS